AEDRESSPPAPLDRWPEVNGAPMPVGDLRVFPVLRGCGEAAPVTAAAQPTDCVRSESPAAFVVHSRVRDRRPVGCLRFVMWVGSGHARRLRPPLAIDLES